MKLLFENWREYLNENQEVWYHGGKIEDKLRPIYLTDDVSISSMYPGKLYSFIIKPDAEWMNLSSLEFSVGLPASISMDAGPTEKQINWVRENGYDIVWNREDFDRGYRQIFVVNPDVLAPSPKVKDPDDDTDDAEELRNMAADMEL